MTDDYPAAKLGEKVRGDLGDNPDLHRHAGLADGDALEMLNFLESLGLDHDLPETTLGQNLRRNSATRRVSESTQQFREIANIAVGLTDSDVDMTSAKAFSKIARSLMNNGAPYNGVLFGTPNTGKTNFALLYVELWKEICSLKYDSPGVVVTNQRDLPASDYTVNDIQEFKSLLFGDDRYLSTDGKEGTPPKIDPSTPVFWLFDECSTHLDSRQFSYEVSSQYLPLLKRFAKVNIDSCHIGHSGMDIHKDLRRDTMTTEFVFKLDLKRAEVHESMHEDKGNDLIYTLDPVPETSLDYDPDAYAPWNWAD